VDPLPPNIVALAERLGADFAPPVALVGGAVRDLLLGGEPIDLDLAVEGPLEPVIERLGGTLRDHDRFGTATLAYGGGQLDLARARRETYRHPGALPHVEPADLLTDLARRDFTVNAIALVLTGVDRDRLLSVPGARGDLETRRLRVLHDESFRDDPTRLLRLARYAGRLGFEVEPGTAALAAAAVADDALRTVSGTRIGNELRLLAREADPLAAFSALRRLGLDESIAPGFGVRDPERARRGLELLPPEARRDRLVLACALEGVQENRRAGLLDTLAFRAGDRAAILAAARAGSLSARLAGATRPSEIARAIDGAGPEAVALAGAQGAEAPARAWLEQLRHVRLQIDGGDLLAHGVKPGAAVGNGLRAALAAALDGEAPGRDEQLAVALRAARD
jgi:tRNA nucleotidyltransferase (CCA-adding enzyme)